MVFSIGWSLRPHLESRELLYNRYCGRSREIKRLASMRNDSWLLSGFYTSKHSDFVRVHCTYVTVWPVARMHWGGNGWTDCALNARFKAILGCQKLWENAWKRPKHTSGYWRHMVSFQPIVNSLCKFPKRSVFWRGSLSFIEPVSLARMSKHVVCQCSECPLVLEHVI